MKTKVNLFLYSIRYIWDYNKIYVIIGFFMSIFLGALSYFFVYFNQKIIDSLVHLTFVTAITFIILLLTLELIEYGVGLYSQYYNSAQNEKFTLYCENSLHDYISRLNLLEREQPGFTATIHVVRLGMSKLLSNYHATSRILKSIISTALSVSILLDSYLFISILIIVVSIVRGIMFYKVIDPIIQNNLEHTRKYAVNDYYSSLLKRKDAQKEMIVFNAYPFFKNKWTNSYKSLIDLLLKTQRINIRPLLIGQIISNMGKSVIYISLAVLVVNQTITVGQFVALMMATTIAESNIQNLMTELKNVLENLKYIEEYHKRFHGLALSNIDTNPKHKLEFKFHNEISLKGVSFSYKNQINPSLININFSIKKGEKVAIIGNNAAGKSTLIKILTGLYPTCSDSVFYDGIAQESYNLSSVWNKCGINFQDFGKYKISIKENIMLGDQGIEQRVINDLIHKFSMDSLESMPEKLDTLLGELDDTAVDLSGGQWQKIALIRLMCRKLELIILDEPTAALDPVSELHVFNELLRLANDKTVIIISHRLGIAREVDRIVYMRDGKILEEGNHSELMDSKGLYYETWLAQSEWYQ